MRKLLSLSKSCVRSCGLLLPLLLGEAVTQPSTAQAQSASPQPDPAARQAFEDGRTFYDHGRFADALRKFQESYALSNNPKLLFNIARAADSDGDQAQAADAYTAYLQRVPDADNREFVEARLAKLRGSNTAPAGPPAQADAPIDPYPPAYVSPGQQQVVGAQPVPYQAAPVVDETPPHFPGRFRLYGGLRVGVGGTMTLTFADDSTEEQNLDASFGGQLGLEFLPSRFFGIGFETRVISFKDEGGNTRDLLVDLSIKPSGRVALRRVPIEFYGALPIGVTVPSVDDPRPDDDSDVEFGVGANFGVMAGMNWFMSPKVGLNFELGALFHWYGAEVSEFGESLGEVDITLSQFTLLTANLVFAP